MSNECRLRIYAFLISLLKKEKKEAVGLMKDSPPSSFIISGPEWSLLGKLSQAQEDPEEYIHVSRSHQFPPNDIFYIFVSYFHTHIGHRTQTHRQVGARRPIAESSSQKLFGIHA